MHLDPTDHNNRLAEIGGGIAHKVLTARQRRALYTLADIQAELLAAGFVAHFAEEYPIGHDQLRVWVDDPEQGRFAVTLIMYLDRPTS